MLSKMRVLSFSHFVQGPAASQYLADLGADVIKVEPLTGAFERNHAGGRVFVKGLSASYLAVNRNKKSIAVDLKNPLAKEVLYKVIQTCDVVTENYRGGVLDRLGFGYEAVKVAKPDIIYASASGWGAKGPMADKPGQDLLVQARCGLVSVTGNLRDAPTVPGVPLVDQHGAALLAMGIMAAYVKKLATGKGTRVESNLLNAGLDLQVESMAIYFSGNKEPKDFVRHHQLASWFLDAPYGVYKLADCHAVISLGGDIEQFTTAIGNKDLIALGKDRMATRDEFTRILAKELLNWTYADLNRALNPHALWYERVQNYDEIKADPQVIQNECLMEIPVKGGTATVLAHPVRYDGTAPGLRRMPVDLGADTRAVLRDAGFSDDAIGDLVSNKVVFDPSVVCQVGRRS
jgi:crotonobetainyl-CoA:carnitine CoA-transferase CaiB-like acyl-CoA transferase